LFAVWGGALWGVLPGAAGISWEGHLFGALGGLIAAQMVGRVKRSRTDRSRVDQSWSNSS
jgi:membrane associated rhomboid family serine protease